MNDYRLFRKKLLLFIMLAALLWLTFYLIWALLPGIRSGSDQIYLSKKKYIRQQSLFSAPPKGSSEKKAKARVVIFGNSKVLSGFKTPLFEELSQGKVEAFNLGLPNAKHFVQELEHVVQHQPAPTHVLLTILWSDQPPKTLWEELQDDDLTVSRLFPFRRLIRDMTLFAMRSRKHGGLRAYYQKVMFLLQDVIDQKGYHFIESQSHYPNHQLPPSFRLDTDSSEKPIYRQGKPAGVLFEKMQSIAKTHNIKILLMPLYFRQGERGETTYNTQLATQLESHGIEVVGPDYWLFENKYFSDPVHLNQQGAELYTQKLWKLFDQHLNHSSHEHKTAKH